jgi:photosystem II stability/assembly factor-like uncharacterized protein
MMEHPTPIRRLFGLCLVGIAFAVRSLSTMPVEAAPSSKEPPEVLQAALERRAEIPLGGDFKPNPTIPMLVAVGHGGRVLLSRDDGQTWKQVFWGFPGSDHGPWATKSVVYTNGVFVVAIGWTTPTTWLASDDGERWRHLSDGKANLPEMKGPDAAAAVMPSTWGLAAGKGAVVSAGSTVMAASPDLGKSITTFSLSSCKNDPRPRKFATHHVRPIYCGDESGRFLAIGNDRSKDNPVFGNLFASDDLGKTWRWMEPQLLNEKCPNYGDMISNGRAVLLVDTAGANAFVSADAGENWEGPFPTGADRAAASVVGKEFWLVGSKGSRASVDGKVWRDLPKGIPSGEILATPEGTLINIEKRRCSILRSTDGGKTWHEAHAFEPETEHVHGGQGLRDIVFGLASPSAG